MLKNIQVFDKKVFQSGTPIKIKKGSTEFFALVIDCDLELLTCITVLPPGSTIVSYTKSYLQWFNESDDIKTVRVKVQNVIAEDPVNKVEILLLERAFNIQGVELR